MNILHRYIMMPKDTKTQAKNKFYGKNINQLERRTQALLPQMVLEATGFPTLVDYAEALQRHFYPHSRTKTRSIVRTLRRYIKERYGQEWYEEYFTRRHYYLSRAGRYLGVPARDVLLHLQRCEIDIATFTRAAFPQCPEQAYNYFFTTLQRRT